MRHLVATSFFWLLGSACFDPVAPEVPSPVSIEPSTSQPDVLIVVLDTVRPDKLSAYGYDKPTSPQLDAVAAAGVMFEDVTAPGSWTWPSHASLFTGVGPWTHGAHASLTAAGVRQSEGYVGVLSMRTDLPTLAERFSEAGYQTVSLASNSFLDPKLGLTRGFDIAEVLKDSELPARAKTLLEAPRDRPLFLFINIMLAHAPWEAGPAPWAKLHADRLSPGHDAPEWSKGFLMSEFPGIDFYKTPPGSKMSGFKQLTAGSLVLPPEDLPLVEDLYTGGITVADYMLNKILKIWNRDRADGIVAVTSDHGEYLGEHGMWEHGKTVFGEVVAVPLIIAAPGRLPKGKRISTPVQLHDLHDTVLELAAVSTDTPRSLVGLVQGDEWVERPIQAKAWASGPWHQSVGGIYSLDWSLYREGSEALVFSSGGDRMLFDLSVDPGMTKDLSGERDHSLQSMWTRAQVAFPEPTASTGLEVSPEVMEDLRALGYLE